MGKEERARATPKPGAGSWELYLRSGVKHKFEIFIIHDAWIMSNVL